MLVGGGSSEVVTGSLLDNLWMGRWEEGVEKWITIEFATSGVTVTTIGCGSTLMRLPCMTPCTT